MQSVRAFVAAIAIAVPSLLAAATYTVSPATFAAGDNIKLRVTASSAPYAEIQKNDGGGFWYSGTMQLLVDGNVVASTHYAGNNSVTSVGLNFSWPFTSGTHSVWAKTISDQGAIVSKSGTLTVTATSATNPKLWSGNVVASGTGYTYTVWASNADGSPIVMTLWIKNPKGESVPFAMKYYLGGSTVGGTQFYSVKSNMSYCGAYQYWFKATTPAGGSASTAVVGSPQVPCYTVSGNAGTGGTSLTLIGASTIQTTASAAGDYQFASLPPGAYSVTPARQGCTFTPSSANLSIVNAGVMQSFTASCPSAPASFVTQKPVTWDTENFGWRFMGRADYGANGATYYVYHPAADLNVFGDEKGTVGIYAAADGTVLHVDPLWGVVLAHDVNGVKFYTLYMHAKVLTGAQALVDGQKVSRGKLIAYIGNVAGSGTVPYHVHFGVLSPLHPNPANVGYWGVSGSEIRERKQVFEKYEAPIAWLEQYLDPSTTTVIVEDSVTYDTIDSDIRASDNAVYFNNHVVKTRFFSSHGLQEWSPSAPPAESRGYEGNYHYATTRAAGDDSVNGIWYVTVPADADYDVYVNVPVVSSATQKAKYEISHNWSTNVVTIDQSQVTSPAVGNRWKLLGRFRFTASASSKQFIRLSAGTGEVGRTVGYDALKLVKR